LNYSGKRIVVVDFETYFDRKQSYDLKSLSLTEYVRDSRFWPLGMAYRFLDDEKTHWLAGNHPIEAWTRSVDWKNTVVVAHNAKFDGSILAWHYGIKSYAWMDTMALAKAVLGENVSSHSLKRLAEYLGLPAKGEVSCEGVLHPSQEQLAALGEYCKNDVDICKGIYEKLIPQFPLSQIFALDWTIRAFVEPRLVLDRDVLEKGVQDEKKRREEIIEKSGVDKTILSSNKQFGEYLASKGISVPTKLSARTGKQIPAFAKTDNGLSQLRGISPVLYEARIAAKSNLLETRGESLLAVAKTGSFPFDVGFSGAVQTHRYSGGSGAGGNPQNFTRQSFLRDAVCAPGGHSLVVGDFAAIELRLLAWLCNEQRLISKLLNDEDVYADFASLKYGRRITKADKAERQFGKGAILGLGYNMGAKKFKATIKAQTGMDISEDEAWKTVRLYRETYSNVPRRWEQADALLPLIAKGQVGCVWFAPFIKVRKNALILPSGLEIKYPNLRQVGDDWVYDVYRKVYEAEPTNLYGGKIIENICQALAGELCKEAIKMAVMAGLHPVGQVHDEILCVDIDPDFAVEKLKECMEKSPTWMPTLKLKAEVKTGRNWNEAK
jgi:DNA polymerase I-like protein with 3'-5' exonuclease and polymerase domains